MRHEATITSKGQITIPAALRAKWNLKDGDKVEIYSDADGNVLMRQRNLPPTAVFERFKDEVMVARYATDDEAMAAAIHAKDMRSKGKGRANDRD
ncbi:MAG: AbrB/MazE/SpoVT family DNA-binding domain-containing protein [Hyphomicrobiales bacterium]|nr:AbrB/MazE/SpoVT family DNA-binding domain-containing protein [Hyphomicrobiales bacterium]